MPEIVPANADIQRVLDAAARKGVVLDVTVFDQSTHTAEEAAAAVGAELGQIVKSLVFVAPGDGGDLELIVCLVSGPNRVDLARLAAVTGERDVRRATAREARELTGFVIGGIPPIAHAQPARVIMDPDLGRFPTVWAAAGSPTAVFPVPPATLRTIANAMVAPITEERRPADIEAEREAAAGIGGLVGGGRTPAPNAGGVTGSSAGAQPHDATITYPGGLRARWRWAGSGQGRAVFALSEAGGTLVDHGLLVSSDPEALCRAELRIDGPGGSWSVRLASTIYDEPAGLLWDDPGLFIVKYGFHTYALEARSGVLRWSHRSATPLLAVVASPRLAHVIAQAEIETFALEEDGTVAWRIAHSDVVTEVELIGGRLVLTSFGGQVTALDPATGRPTG